MSLRTYQEKRRFNDTPEPEGEEKQGRGALRFVVQKHFARRAHYDFRLEMDGVMKSWAVPKGPSLNPKDKRLAVMVEDHPLEYRTFEGIIPKGNYGAGTVMIWDEGAVEPLEPGANRAENEKKLLDGIAKEHLRFVLHGEKLKGSFSLVRTKRGKNEWLLFKRSDEFASEKDVTQEDRSVVSRRTMEEIAAEAAGRGDVWQSNQPKRQVRPLPIAVPDRAPKGKMPHAVKPMLATLVEKPFDAPGWVFEVKWDGFRAIAEIESGKVRLYSRNQLTYNDRFPSIVNAVAQLGHDAVLDGEIVVLDAEGKARFELLQKYQSTGKGWLIYYVFDILHLDGHDLRNLPLLERKALLPALVRGFNNIKVSEHVPEKGIAFHEAVAQMGLEGLVAKKADSSYREGARSQSWLKLKVRQQQEAVICGFTAPRGSREKLGSLVLGVYEDSKLTYIGRAGAGFDGKSLASVFARLEPLVQKESPFKPKPKIEKPTTWVKPELVCEVAFQNWTDDGELRFPVFLGLREDKAPRSVTRERAQPLPKAAEKAAEQAQEAEATGNGQVKPTRATNAAANFPEGKFTNLDKIYWPEDKITKGDMLAYYHDIAPFIVPYLRDRPMSMNRHPNGIHGKNFFQKDVSRQKPPEWVPTTDAPSERHGHVRYVLCQDERTLLYVANLGCIELNPWHSRVGSFDNPDYLIIDLDPQDVPFEQVVETAQVVRQVLEKGCSESYCKTSGKRGLHVYVPLGAKYDFDQAKQFGEIIAHIVRSKLPQTTSIERSPARRRNRIYLDYLQNRRGQTIAAAYSLRPIEGALVSTPLAWKEVGKHLDPTKFNIKTIRKRLDQVGDLWAPVLGGGVDMQKCLESLQG